MVGKEIRTANTAFGVTLAAGSLLLFNNQRNTVL